MNTHKARMLLAAVSSIWIMASGSCAAARPVSLSEEDRQTITRLREEFSAGVVDGLLATGDYTRSRTLNAEALARDAEEVRDAKIRAIAERSARNAAALAQATAENRTAERATPSVEDLSVIEGSVDGVFNGFDGDTVIRLQDGSAWEQTQFYWEWHWAYGPRVIVYRSQGVWKMQVEGIREAVEVRRLK